VKRAVSIRGQVNRHTRKVSCGDYCTAWERGLDGIKGYVESVYGVTTQ
jgi:hypothetical protein